MKGARGFCSSSADRFRFNSRLINYIAPRDSVVIAIARRGTRNEPYLRLFINKRSDKRFVREGPVESKMTITGDARGAPKKKEKRKRKGRKKEKKRKKTEKKVHSTCRRNPSPLPVFLLSDVTTTSAIGRGLASARSLAPSVFYIYIYVYIFSSAFPFFGNAG